MTRRAALTTLSILAALSLSACDEGEVTCDDLSCDPDAELCVFSGSDTDDPPDLSLTPRRRISGACPAWRPRTVRVRAEAAVPGRDGRLTSRRRSPAA